MAAAFRRNARVREDQLIVTTIEDALKLLLDWVGRPDIVIPERDMTPGQLPCLKPVTEVSDALGTDVFHSGLPLLLTQDRIFRPEELHASSNGYITFIVENQGVYSLGYRPDYPERLFVSGDWVTGSEETVPPGWRRLQMTPEDALIMTVLVNGFFGLSGHLRTRDEPDFNTLPPETDVRVWHHPAMGAHWPGFWTNSASSMLHFGGFGQTLMRA